MNVDPYELLGLSRSATEAEAAKAYFRLTDVFSPDRWEYAERAIRVDALRWQEALDDAVVAVLRTIAASDQLVSTTIAVS